MPKAKKPLRRFSPIPRLRQSRPAPRPPLPPVQPLPTYVAPRPILRPSLPPESKADTRLQDIAALHAPDRNVSGEYYCKAGCKGAYPCPTMQIIEREP